MYLIEIDIPSLDTQPPLLTLATSYVYEAGGVNNSNLLWALPRLEKYVETLQFSPFISLSDDIFHRYIEWDLLNRDHDQDGLLEWHRFNVHD